MRIPLKETREHLQDLFKGQRPQPEELQSRIEDNQTTLDTMASALQAHHDRTDDTLKRIEHTLNALAHSIIDQHRVLSTLHRR
ncbi:MAG: hypothetical protein ACRDTA_15240, partial [Pseudonocardiaceae bacterium]